MKSTVIIAIATAAVSLFVAPAAAGTIQSLGNFIPGGIDGNNIAGTEFSQGYIYNLVTKTFTPIPNSTAATGISGNNVVGGWGNNQGFLYNLATKAYTALIDPLANGGMFVEGVQGNGVVGQYVDSSGKTHGFLYDIGLQTYTTLDDPLGVKGTYPRAIDGNNIVGAYVDASGAVHAFLYDGANWFTLPPDNGLMANPTGISGNKIVGGEGTLPGSQGFVYDISTGIYSHPTPNFSSVTHFPVYGWGFNGVSGDTVVGPYTLFGRGTFGFIATIPEPGSLILALAAAACFILWFRCRASPISRARL